MSWQVKVGRCDRCGNIHDEQRLMALTSGERVCPTCRRDFMVEVFKDNASYARPVRSDPDYWKYLDGEDGYHDGGWDGGWGGGWGDF